jgi:hypothetical protein
LGGQVYDCGGGSGVWLGVFWRFCTNF